MELTHFIIKYYNNKGIFKFYLINIKSFYAQDPTDSALFDLLPILIEIDEEEEDVRDGLSKYRNDIVFLNIIIENLNYYFNNLNFYI